MPPASRLSLFDARSTGDSIQLSEKSRWVKPTGQMPSDSSGRLHRATTPARNQSPCPMCPNLLGCRSIPAPGGRPDTAAAERSREARDPWTHPELATHLLAPSGLSATWMIPGSPRSPMRSRPSARFIGRTTPALCPTARSDRPPSAGRRHPSAHARSRRRPADRRNGAVGRANDASRLILCISPYVRYEELERGPASFDLVVSEATAADVLARATRPPARWARPRDDRRPADPACPDRGGRRR